MNLIKCHIEESRGPRINVKFFESAITPFVSRSIYSRAEAMGAISGRVFLRVCICMCAFRTLLMFPFGKEMTDLCKRGFWKWRISCQRYDASSFHYFIRQKCEFIHLAYARSIMFKHSAVCGLQQGQTLPPSFKVSRDETLQRFLPQSFFSLIINPCECCIVKIELF